MKRVKSFIFENDIRILYAFNIIYKRKLFDKLCQYNPSWRTCFYNYDACMLMLFGNDYLKECGKNCLISLINKPYMCTLYKKSLFKTKTLLDY
ncbi:MAG: hypothetical protein KatS3mg079_364 [Caloramator sp.]|nr:MAG: hypothetical protein KatS3mg079_364 [Caloramator sp.]